MKKIIFVLALLIVGVNFAYAEEVLITLSTELDDVDFDGTWSYYNEWKPTSLVKVENNDSSFVYKIAHDYENLFVYVSAISDKTPKDSGFFLFPDEADRAIICIDGKNNGGEKPADDDFCFIATMGTDKVLTLQGGSDQKQDGFYKTIDNHSELIGIGAVSSEFDRHSKIPHSTYEFKIPVEIFGRSDVYGLYVGVFDSNLSIQYGWPQESTEPKYPFIPNPESWGQMVSPDKTLPEFEIPLLMLSSTLILIVVLARRRVNLFRLAEY